MGRVSTEIPIEKLGPPCIRGQLHVLAVRPNEQRTDTERLTDTSDRRFTIYGLLSKFPASSTTISGSFSETDGGSFLLAPIDAAMVKIDTPEGQFLIHKNVRGEFSLVEFSCMSTTANGARQRFYKGVMPFFDHVSYVTNSPIYIVSIKIDDSTNYNQILEYTGPHQKSVVNTHEGRFVAEMEPIYAMYHEAKKAHSDFYKFLCYYKIMEGLLGVLRSKAFKSAKMRGLALPKIKEVVPALPGIPTEAYRPYIGKPLKNFFDNVLTPQFRNAVAHFITDDQAILNMSNPDHIYEYTNIILIAELCARVAIATHEAFMNVLHI